VAQVPRMHFPVPRRERGTSQFAIAQREWR